MMRLIRIRHTSLTTAAVAVVSARRSPRGRSTDRHIAVSADLPSGPRRRRGGTGHDQPGSAEGGSPPSGRPLNDTTLSGAEHLPPRC